MNRWFVWSLYVLGWTVLLEIPIRPPEDVPGGEFIITNRYLIAKSLHVAVYAGMAILTGWTSAQLRFRPFLMFFLMGHATATELLQEWLEPYCHRGGSLADVGFDHVGIAVGLAISWKWWTRSDQT